LITPPWPPWPRSRVFSGDQKLVFEWARLNSRALLDFWNDGDVVNLLAQLKPLRYWNYHSTNNREPRGAYSF
jgi:hypothetical protein